MKKLFFLLAFLSFAIVSCEKEPILTLSVEQIAAPANGNSTSVTVTTNNPWTVSGNDWCTVSPSSGEAGSVMITVTVKENTTYDPRDCSLTFMSKGLAATISVSQETNYGIILPKNTFEVSNEAQQISVEVKANVEYEVAIGADWIIQSGSKALVSKELKFDIAENNTYDDRECVITIKERNGALLESVKVHQKQKDAVIIVPKECNVSNQATSIEVLVQTNIEIIVDIEEDAKDWISYSSTKALENRILVFNITANEGYSMREGKIIVRDNNNVVSDTLTIKQNQTDALFIVKDKFELDSENQIISLTIETNVDYQIIIPEKDKTWISINSTKALSTKEDELVISNNDTKQNRESELIIKQLNGQIEKRVSILQYKAPENLSVNGCANSYIVNTSGWYYFNAKYKGNSNDVVGEIETVEVLWETYNTEEIPTIGSIITEVELKDDNIKFCIPDQFNKGNALIVAKNAVNQILWSWHIWVTEYNPEEDFDTYISGAIMMDRDLGALSSTPEDGFLTNGLMYQWGRKDPFMNVAGYTGSVKNLNIKWFMAKSSTDVERKIETSKETGNVEFAIQNPSVIIEGNGISKMDWLYYTRDNFLWASEKTKYDPCPVGWRVPTGSGDQEWRNPSGPSTNEWAGFPTNIIDRWDEDKLGVLIEPPYSTPAAWFHLNGNLNAVNSFDINLWTAATNDNMCSNYIEMREYTRELSWWYFSGRREELNAVRCVKD